MSAHRFILEDNWDGGKTLYYSDYGILRPVKGFYQTECTEDALNEAIGAYLVKKSLVGESTLERES